MLIVKNWWLVQLLQLPALSCARTRHLKRSCGKASPDVGVYSLLVSPVLFSLLMPSVSDSTSNSYCQMPLILKLLSDQSNRGWVVGTVMSPIGARSVGRLGAVPSIVKVRPLL